MDFFWGFILEELFDFSYDFIVFMFSVKNINGVYDFKIVLDFWIFIKVGIGDRFYICSYIVSYIFNFEFF